MPSQDFNDGREIESLKQSIEKAGIPRYLSGTVSSGADSCHDDEPTQNMERYLREQTNLKQEVETAWDRYLFLADKHDVSVKEAIQVMRIYDAGMRERNKVIDYLTKTLAKPM